MGRSGSGLLAWRSPEDGRTDAHGRTFAEAEAMPASLLAYEELVQRNVVGPGQRGSRAGGGGPCTQLLAPVLPRSSSSPPRQDVFVTTSRQEPGPGDGAEAAHQGAGRRPSRPCSRSR